MPWSSNWETRVFQESLCHLFIPAAHYKCDGQTDRKTDKRSNKWRIDNVSVCLGCQQKTNILVIIFMHKLLFAFLLWIEIKRIKMLVNYFCKNSSAYFYSLISDVFTIYVNIAMTVVASAGMWSKYRDVCTGLSL